MFVHLTCLSGSQMGQSPLEQKMDLGHSRKVQSEIFLNQEVYFEYTQLLQGVEMFQLILGARGAPLMNSRLCLSGVHSTYATSLRGMDARKHPRTELTGF